MRRNTNTFAGHFHLAEERRRIEEPKSQSSGFLFLFSAILDSSGRSGAIREGKKYGNAYAIVMLNFHADEGV